MHVERTVCGRAILPRARTLAYSQPFDVLIGDSHKAIHIYVQHFRAVRNWMRRKCEMSEGIVMLDRMVVDKRKRRRLECRSLLKRRRCRRCRSVPVDATSWNSAELAILTWQQRNTKSFPQVEVPISYSRKSQHKGSSPLIMWRPTLDPLLLNIFERNSFGGAHPIAKVHLTI